MRLVGMMPCRMEEWSVGLSLRVALKFCDSVVVLVHASTDRTQEIVTDIAKETGRVIVVGDDKPIWDEMRHRQALLEIARTDGATHLFICDADEVLCANTVPIIRQTIERMWSDGILHLPLYNLRGGINRYHANGVWGNRIVSAAFADNPALSWSGDKFHSREPRGALLRPYRPIAHGSGGVMHLWGASERRLRAKCSWYKVQEHLRWPNKPVAEIDRMYSWAIHGEPDQNQVQHRAFGTPATWQYAAVPPEWWAAYEAEGLMKYLDVHAEPYQEVLIRDAVATHGHPMFYGLDLFNLEK